MAFIKIKVFPDDQATGLWDQNGKLIELDTLILTDEIVEDLTNMQFIYNKKDFYKMSDKSIEDCNLYFINLSKKIATKLKVIYPNMKIYYLSNNGLIEITRVVNE